MKATACFLLLNVLLLTLTQGQITMNVNEIPITKDKANPVEYLLTANVDFGEGQSKSVQTIIDNSVVDTYIFEKGVSSAKCWSSSTKNPLFSCEKECKIDQKDTKSYQLDALNNMADISVKKAEVKVDITDTQNESKVMDDVPVRFVESITPKNSQKKELIKALFQQGGRAGLGFGYGKSNFLNKLFQHKFIEYKGFSFWLTDDYMRLYLGKSQSFFQQYSPALTMARIEDSDDWKVKLVQAKYGDSLLQPSKQNVEAIISTTTAFVHIPSSQFNKFTTLITNEGNNACSTQDNKETYTCKCNAKELNDLKLTFEEFVDEESVKQVKAHKENQELSIKVKDYLVYLDDKLENDNPKKSCQLMIKKGYEPEGKTDSETWVLGTPFLKSNYVYFNAQTNQIEASKLYDFTREDKHINTTAYVWFLVAGILLALVSLCILLQLFPKVKYEPSQDKPITQTIYPSAFPVQYSPSRQVVRTFVSPSQPQQLQSSVQYVQGPTSYQQTFPYQQPTTIIQQSPSRVQGGISYTYKQQQ